MRKLKDTKIIGNYIYSVFLKLKTPKVFTFLDVITSAFNAVSLNVSKNLIFGICLGLKNK